MECDWNVWIGILHRVFLQLIITSLIIAEQIVFDSIGEVIANMSIASNSIRKEISKKSPSKELTEDAKNAISVIKGLIKTRKQITTVKDIEREYLEMEGQKIPFKTLGFKSLDQLMRASGEFHLSNSNGEV